MKNTMPFQDMTWRTSKFISFIFSIFNNIQSQDHMDLISKIHFNVKLDVIDHWLASIGENSAVIEKAQQSYFVIIIIIIFFLIYFHF